MEKRQETKAVKLSFLSLHQFVLYFKNLQPILLLQTSVRTSPSHVSIPSSQQVFFFLIPSHYGDHFVSKWTKVASHVLSKYTALSITVLLQCLSDSSVLLCSGSLSFGPIWNGSLSLADLKNMNQKHKSPKLLIYGIYNCSAKVCKWPTTISKHSVKESWKGNCIFKQGSKSCL